MKWSGCVYTGGFSYVDANDLLAVQRTRVKAQQHARRLAATLKAL